MRRVGKAKRSEAKRSEARQSEAKRGKAKRSEAKRSVPTTAEPESKTTAEPESKRGYGAFRAFAHSTRKRQGNANDFGVSSCHPAPARRLGRNPARRQGGPRSLFLRPPRRRRAHRPLQEIRQRH